MDDKELLWRQYSLSVDLFKHYLKLVVEFNIFFYGITGGVLSYYFSHSTEKLMHYALFLPLVMSVLFAAFFLYGAYLMGALRSEIFAVRDSLNLTTAPDAIVLTVFLCISAALMVLVAIGLGIVIWCPAAV